MMVAQLLSGDAVWMANPSSLNKDRNEIVFAHCTVPTTFLSDVSFSGLTTHMESNKSTAIRGPLNPGEVTIMRFASTFDKVIAVRGKIVQSDMKNANLCRTQAVIKIEGDVEEWMNKTFGNHHVIVYGNLIPQLEHFCDFTDVELIKI
jgi:L-fucose isomerase-like protein